MSSTARRQPARGSGASHLPADTSGINLLPFASMAGGWVAPLLMFWLYVWGPLRPFRYPAGDLLPSLPWTAAILSAVALWWLPPSYFRIRPIERSGRIYEAVGVRRFRWLVPDGDAANRWRRRREPGFRVIRGRRDAVAFLQRTQLSERSHLVLLALGGGSAVFAWSIGWSGWALYLGIGNVLVNLYPVLLQRYTRARLERCYPPDRRAGRLPSADRTEST